MGREDWDLSHEYEAHDHHIDDDREWFLEIISHGVLFLAAVGLVTLAPWLVSLAGFVLSMFFGVLAGLLKLVAAVLGLAIGAVALAVSLVLKVALIAVSLITYPPVLLVMVLVVVLANRR